MHQEDEGGGNPLSWGRGQGEGPSPWHAEEAARRTNTRPGKSHGFQAFRIPQVALYHALWNLREPKSAHEFF